MSDNFDGGPDFSEGGEAPVGGKAKGRGGAGAKAILNLLKWIGIGLGFVILVVVIVVIVVRILGTQSKPLTELPNAETMQRSTPTWATFSNIDPITTTVRGQKDNEEWSIMIEIILAYDEKDKTVPTELGQRRSQMQDFLRRYISQKRIEELLPAQELILKEDLRTQLNNNILSKPFIKDIYFGKFQRSQM
ncbi:MAG: flagellar basal body-associated FliL family protein [Spirochaetes bacterium]|nr:flagellar basal body-associated FliL family protein [Spirochaetota bacterium]MBU0955339.1 flagellar basal body-associated FliL family protein [Spirochaetota bacterium]